MGRWQLKRGFRFLVATCGLTLASVVMVGCGGSSDKVADSPDHRGEIGRHRIGGSGHRTGPDHHDDLYHRSLHHGPIHDDHDRPDDDRASLRAAVAVAAAVEVEPGHLVRRPTLCPPA